MMEQLRSVIELGIDGVSPHPNVGIGVHLFDADPQHPQRLIYLDGPNGEPHEKVILALSILSSGKVIAYCFNRTRMEGVEWDDGDFPVAAALTTLISQRLITETQSIGSRAEGRRSPKTLVNLLNR